MFSLGLDLGHHYQITGTYVAARHRSCLALTHTATASQPGEPKHSSSHPRNDQRPDDGESLCDEGENGQYQVLVIYRSPASQYVQVLRRWGISTR